MGVKFVGIDMQLLKAKLKYNDRTYAEIAKAIGINRDTFAKRLITGRFLISDVQKMMDVIPLSIDEMEDIFFIKK